MQPITSSASRQGTRGWGSHGPPAALQPRARLAWPTLLSSRTHRVLARVELAAALGSMMEWMDHVVLVFVCNHRLDLRSTGPGVCRCVRLMHVCARASCQCRDGMSACEKSDCHWAWSRGLACDGHTCGRVSASCVELVWGTRLSLLHSLCVCTCSLPLVDTHTSAAPTDGCMAHTCIHVAGESRSRACRGQL